jgi:hypothetical protein
MRLLLDTHVFLWYISADPQLPVAFRDAIRDPANEVYLSVASVWEAVIKYAQVFCTFHARSSAPPNGRSQLPRSSGVTTSYPATDSPHPRASISCRVAHRGGDGSSGGASNAGLWSVGSGGSA